MSLLSFEFFLLSFGTAVYLWSARGLPRTLGFLGASGYFAYTYLGWGGLAFTLWFCLTGFACATLVRRQPRMLWAVLTGLTVVFIYARSYSFLEWILPDGLITNVLATAGLSFLFFKILHVIIDTAGAALPPIRLSSYLAYCFNFTAFLLGPIQRYQDFQAQWEGRVEAIPASFEAHLDALNRVLRGLVKKYVVAEFLFAYALQADAAVGSFSLLEIQLQTYLFYAFLYFDFSGYCDIVIGVGCLMGVRPPENFNLPFLSANPAQYWLRVHESLTRWLTDYVFNPSYAWALRSGILGSHRMISLFSAVMLTMLVTGLWHGTTFAFVLFGLTHGVYMVVFRGYESLVTRWWGRGALASLRASRTWLVFSTLVTFHFTASAYIFFVLDASQLLIILQRL